MTYRMSYKLNYVRQYGRIKHDKNEWVFIAQPGKGCPILTLTNRSKWELIEFIFYYLMYEN
jgi:hypothetical protein